MLDDLKVVRRKTVPLSYELDLHGVKKTLKADVTVTLLTDDLVSIAASTPISLAVQDFELQQGLEKLQDAANVEIVPFTTVSFDLVFARNETDAEVPETEDEPEKPSTAALEVAGNFDAEACKGRFEILSRTGNIYFRSGSRRLDPKSAPLLDSLADIVARCPGMVIEIGGHTDSVGSDAQNRRLSLRRANSVRDYLVKTGLDRAALVAKGYGESEPVADNTTRAGREKNRRIGFTVLQVN